MAEITKQDVVSFIENMSVLELSELIKDLENKFGVSAAAVAMAAPAAAAGGAPGAADAKAEEKTEFNVILKEAGAQKIQVIKVVRAITNLGLKEAKDFVDGAPKTVKEGIPKAEADDIVKQLQEVGAVAEIQ
jgi:large subunit ribosomal protein L7/L12